MKTPIPNAFTINRLGSGPFPFGVSHHVADQSHGPHVLKAFPVRLLDLSDLLQACALPDLLLFEVSHVALDPNTGQIRPLRALAEDKGMVSTAYDEAIIKIRTDQFQTLLDGLPHYDLQLLDLPEDANDDTVLAAYVTATDHRCSGSSTTLPHLPGSRLFVDIHDDCYLYLEAWQESLPQEVLARMLQLYVGTVAYQQTQELPDVGAPSATILTQLWQRFPSLTSLRHFASLDGQNVKLGFSGTEFSFREERAYPLAGHIRYGLETGEWELLLT